VAESPRRSVASALSAVGATIRDSSGAALVTGLAAGLGLGGMTLATALYHDVSLSERLMRVVAVFACGGLLGGFVAHLAAELVTGRASPLRRFAAYLALMPVAVLAAVEFSYLLDFTGFLTDLYSEGSLAGALWALAFAGATTLYTLFGAGLPPLMPWAAILLVLGAILFARRGRR
jgi:hypothetical protein